MKSSIFFLLNSHLFPSSELPFSKDQKILMIEDYQLYTRFKYHKKRLVFMMEAMRNHADLLVEKGYPLIYLPLDDSKRQFSLEEKIAKVAKKEHVESIKTFEIEDRFLRHRLTQVFKKLKLKHSIHPSPLFLHTTSDLQAYFGNTKQPHMRFFYEQERKGLDILMDEKGPKGGRFSFDDENRKPLPKKITIPPRPTFSASPNHQEVCLLVDHCFSKHPGSTLDCWLPTTRKQALHWLDTFCKTYLPQFGPYEDAISTKDPFLFHSVLSPMLNIGLVTPKEVLNKVLAQKKIPLNSLEGFIRQVIGWREFIRGIDECYGEKQEKTNFFKHQRKLTSAWYSGETGLLPLDNCIKKVIRYGYCHHIERLMILSNLMLLCEINPRAVFCWFMELFADSADWVMGPNVYGMGQFSDGGIFATKPYFCGSNYILKMSDYQKGPWCAIIDGLYWRFVNKHRAFFNQQPRLKMMTLALDKMSKQKKEMLFSQAHNFLKTHTKITS